MESMKSILMNKKTRYFYYLTLLHYWSTFVEIFLQLYASKRDYFCLLFEVSYY